jgi:hypothetical protein
MAKVKATPVPVVEEGCGCLEVYVAVHNFGICAEILGIFTNEKTAKKAASAAKKEDGYRGKEAKLHSYTYRSYTVEDKF